MSSRTDYPNEYTSWRRMRGRCLSIRDKDYKYYGARGIKICKEWDSFSVFVRDMGERPEGTTLGRINNDGNYEPNNCRWETDLEQRANKRELHRGQTHCKHGHEFTESNTYLDGTKRKCRTCRNRAARESKSR